tara:strand:- start:508 stop:642 length:135 start_codon:yes stop_codon:yes gene_type:complete
MFTKLLTGPAKDQGPKARLKIYIFPGQIQVLDEEHCKKLSEKCI